MYEKMWKNTSMLLLKTFNKTIMKIALLFLILPLSFLAQNKYTSAKNHYSFVIIDGWHKKDKIYNPDVEVKIVDGKGNSFIVAVKDNPNPQIKSIRKMMEGISNREFEEGLYPTMGEIEVVRQGITYINNKEFFYLFSFSPFEDGLKLYHKQYSIIYKNKVITIDACSISSYIQETTPIFALMLDSFRLN